MQCCPQWLINLVLKPFTMCILYNVCRKLVLSYPVRGRKESICHCHLSVMALIYTLLALMALSMRIDLIVAKVCLALGNSK